MMMKRIVLFLTMVFYCGFANAVPNLTLVKNELVKYYDSGSYSADIQNVIDTAKKNLIKAVKSNHEHKKLAIVFDIDDTAISNYASLKSVDFGGNYDIRYQLLLKGNQPAIAQTLSLYDLAIQNNIAVFFITGRPGNVKDITERVLKNDGYTKWNDIYFKTDEYKNKSVTEFKTAMRKKITEDGYTIIENIGDQYSDLRGGYSQSQYKIPNPFYYIP